jgi:hypothetical protein
MSNVVFIHAANMAIDKRGRPSLGRCQQIIDRMIVFIMDARIYEDVSAIYLNYTGEKELKFDVPKAVLKHHEGDVHQWEFPTLQQMRAHCRANPEDNVLYLHTQGVSEGFHHIEGEFIHNLIEQRRDYHFYWNITKYKEVLEHLKTYDTCGAMLVALNADVERGADGRPHAKSLPARPVWHYSQNFWWSRAAHINSLPDPQNYPLILDERHQAEFWLCSSTGTGRHKCIHQLYESWCYADDFSKSLYMDEEHIRKFS